MKVFVAQSCLTHCNPMDYSSPGSSGGMKLNGGSRGEDLPPVCLYPECPVFMGPLQYTHVVLLSHRGATRMPTWKEGHSPSMLQI